MRVLGTLAALVCPIVQEERHNDIIEWRMGVHDSSRVDRQRGTIFFTSESIVAS